MNLELARRLKLALRGQSYADELLAILLGTTGSVFYVDSNNGNANWGGNSPDRALTTLNAAVALCTANKGDVIFLMPGHNEVATAIDLDVAGISVIGLGQGAAAPRFDYDTATDTIDIGANGVTLKNVRLLPSVTDVTIAIDVEAAVTDTLIEDVYALPGEDGAGVDDFALVVDIKAGCDRTVVRRLKVRQHASGAGYVAGVKLTGASAGVVIDDCDIWITGAGVVAPINGDTTLSTDLVIQDCLLTSDAEPGIELLTGTTGIIKNNLCFTDLATIAAAIVADGCALYENYYVEVGGEAGVLIGTPSADD